MGTWAATLSSVTLVSLVSLAGLLSLSLGAAGARGLAALLVSFAVGGLLGDAFLHLIPESFAQGAPALRPSLLVLAGILVFFALEKAVLRRHGALHVHARQAGPGRPELVAVNVLGDAIHNFVDGALIAASYLASTDLGVATTVAVLLHEIPQELGDFGVLLHCGYGVRKALLVNLASASLAIAGAVLTLLLGHAAGEAVAATLVPMTAGGFVYIAAADLIPELQQDRSLRGFLQQGFLMALGIALMALLAVPG